MADLYPNAAGSWSTNSNWYNAATGATVNRQPTTGDNVWLNNKTIIVDTTITCDKLSNKAFTGAGFSPVAGGTAQITITNIFSPTLTIGSGGIESSQLTTAGNTITILGSPTSQPSVMQILCSGDITGGFSSAATSHAIYINCTNSKIYITADEILSGITANTAYAIHIPSAATGNTIYVNCTKITGGTAAAINNNTTSGIVIYKATTIEGGNSIAGIQQQNENNASSQYVGYTWDFTTGIPTASPITDITASTTSPAIQSYTGTAPYINKTQFIINATNINGNSNGMDALMLFKALLSVTNIYYYDTPTTFKNYKDQTPSATTVTEASIWAYATRELTSAKNITTDDTKINSTAIKTATDRIPTNPASIESTGGQIASLT
jgi:hypothetical protein